MSATERDTSVLHERSTSRGVPFGGARAPVAHTGGAGGQLAAFAGAPVAGLIIVGAGLELAVALNAVTSTVVAGTAAAVVTIRVRSNLAEVAPGQPNPMRCCTAA